MPAQGGGATARDGPQHLEVLPGDPFTASFDEGASCGANQIAPGSRLLAPSLLSNSGFAKNPVKTVRNIF
jgi:hypothetical protein